MEDFGGAGGAGRCWGEGAGQPVVIFVFSTVHEIDVFLKRMAKKGAFPDAGVFLFLGRFRGVALADFMKKLARKSATF